MRAVQLSYLLIIGLILAGCAGGAESEKALTIAVSIRPLSSLVEALVGEEAEVVLLVPPTMTPHTFQPKPSDVEALSRADLLVLIGFGEEEPWISKLIEGADNPKLKVVELSEGIEPIGDPPNSHFWLSPKMALVMIKNLEEALIEVDPANRSEYEQRVQEYAEKLIRLDQAYREVLATLPDRRFIATRPLFVYLARDYGLEQVAVIAGAPGQQPSPQRLADMIRLIREEQIPLMVGPLQLEEGFAASISEETGIRLVRLDVMGIEHPDYIELMQANLKALVQGFRGEER
jgi:zinc transport system substrate-binding protein